MCEQPGCIENVIPAVARSTGLPHETVERVLRLHHFYTGISRSYRETLDLPQYVGLQARVPDLAQQVRDLYLSQPEYPTLLPIEVEGVNYLREHPELFPVGEVQHGSVVEFVLSVSGASYADATQCLLAASRYLATEDHMREAVRHSPVKPSAAPAPAINSVPSKKMLH